MNKKTTCGMEAVYRTHRNHHWWKKTEEQASSNRQSDSFWGVPVPVLCKRRHERMRAIGDKVAKSDYHLVVLEEVWHKGDYEVIKKKVQKALPYSHYFYSGIIGSGLCIFSKLPIEETLYHRFDLNGYAHKIQHGDWFGGKGVGLAKLTIDGYTVHVYVTHIHAEYNRQNDEYIAHRVSQAFNLSEFVRFTSPGADISFLCGDFNFESVDLGYKIIRTNCHFRDAWIDKKSTSSGLDGNTCDCPGNSFVKQKCLEAYPDGKRIDYILYRARQDIQAEIRECTVTMGRVPGQSYSFSDHEGVMADVTFTRRDLPAPVVKVGELSPLLQEAVTVIDRGIEVTTANHRFFLLFAGICLALVYLVSVIHVPYPLEFAVTFLKLVLILSTGYGVAQNLVMIRCERHGLATTRQDIKHVLQNIHCK